MARFLMATQPITGHVLPALPIARELVERGHEVRWYVGRKFQAQVEATGARFAPYQQAYDYDDADYDAAFPGRGTFKGLEQIKFDFTHVFVKQAVPQFHDLQAIVRGFRADVILGDPSLIAAHLLNEKGGPPFAVYSITCVGFQSRDTAPFGLGLLPDASVLGQIRNRFLNWLAPNVVFGEVSKVLTQQRALLGLSPAVFDGPLSSPFLVLQPSVPAFEYPRSDLAPSVHFIGALLPNAPTNFAPPAWWPEVTAKTRPVILVTQGTVATNAQELIVPTLQALANENVLVIAAGVKDAADLGISLPANARVEAFVPFGPLLPQVDVYITNGGFGGVHYALANGVPVISGGTTEDKPEIGNRVAYSGVGINLKTNQPTPEQIREAVRRVLNNASYRQRAQTLQAELARHDAPVKAASLLEKLAHTKQPVLNGNH